MQRISSPTAVADMWGAGKNGFTDNPPNKTELNAAWFNLVQEEIARCIEDQGVALDALDVGQLATAINNWAFSGDISIKSGAELRVLSGGSLVTDQGASVTVNGDAQLGSDSADTISILGACRLRANTEIGQTSADTLSVVATTTFSSNVTIASGKTLQGADATTVINGIGTIEGALIQTTTTGRVQTRRLQIDAGASVADTQISRDSEGFLHYGAAGLDLLLHASRAGLVYTQGQSDDLGQAAALLLDTDDKIRPLDTSGAETLLVVGSAMVKRPDGSGGSVTVQLMQGDGGAPEAFSVLGSAVPFEVPSVADTYTHIKLTRKVTSPGTTARSYRLRIDGNGGGQAIAIEALIEVKPARVP